LQVRVLRNEQKWTVARRRPGAGDEGRIAVDSASRSLDSTLTRVMNGLGRTGVSALHEFLRRTSWTWGPIGKTQIIPSMGEKKSDFGFRVTSPQECHDVDGETPEKS
jgi:hypothetical protein